MKNINRVKETIIWLLVVAPFIYAAIVWNQAPAQIATHFDASGHADQYSDKTLALLLLPGISLLIYFILLFIPRIDPRYRNYKLFGSSYQSIRLLIHVLLLAIFIYTTEISLRGNNLNSNIFMAAIMIFFALMGNYMRTVRSNFFVGIRTPWTLSNDEVWRRTHEMGGKIWFYGGLAMAILLLFLPSSIAAPVMVPAIVLMALIPVIYSYILYRRIVGSPSQE